MRGKMKKLFVSLRNFIRNKSIVTFIVMFIFLSSSFFAISLFGLSNSSVCYLERSCHSLKSSLGSYVHLRYFLEEESEAKIKSAISVINDFNAYRIKEIDRTASYVLDEDFQVEYDGDFYDSHDILYADYYSEYFTTNRMSLIKGTYSNEDFYKKDTIFISSTLLNTIDDLTVNNAIGKTIKLSLDIEKEYTIKGIVDVEKVRHSGAHFKTLFSDNFVMLNPSHVYDYDFTDLFLCTDDYYFADDLCEFEKQLDKSYLKYDAIDMKATYLDDASKMFTSGTFKMPKYDFVSVVFSILSIVSLVAISLIFLFMVVSYDFNAIPLSERITAFISMFIWSFFSVVLGWFVMGKAILVPRISIILLIGFAAVSSFILLWRFSFFRSSIGDDEVEDGK